METRSDVHKRRLANQQLGKKLHGEAPFTLEDLLDIMRALRDPHTGCPWDREQTFETIAPYTLEEAYEVADAIETGDLTGLRSELGDLLFQVVYHAQMAQEQDHFDFPDICDAICRKMVRRHPHVFGDDSVVEATDVKGLWERIKAEERQENSDPAQHNGQSLLDGVPANLPALSRAAKLQSKAAKVGFDWPSVDQVLDKVDEELGELKEAVKTEPDCKTHLKEELGDLLLVLANVARHLDIDPEQALRGANQKMVRRFSYIERELAAQGKPLQETSLEEMERLWDKAKQIEKEPTTG